MIKLEKVSDPRSIRCTTYTVRRGKSPIETRVNVFNLDHSNKKIEFRGVSAMSGYGEACSFDDIWFGRITFYREINVDDDSSKSSGNSCIDSNHEIVNSSAMGKTFKYCRDCKKEVE